MDPRFRVGAAHGSRALSGGRLRVAGEPAVSIVIVEGDDREAAYRRVESLAQMSDRILPLEVVFVEKSLQEPIAPRLGAGVVRVRPRDGNRGYSAAVNEGAACARASYVLFLDVLAPLSREDLVQMLATLSADGRLAAVGPARTPPRARMRTMRLVARDDGEGNARVRWYGSAEPTRVAWLSCAIMLVRADVLRALGGFDEGCLEHAADEDWCRRATRRGYAVVCLPCEHVVRDTRWTSLLAPVVRSERAVADRARIVSRHFGRTAAWAYSCGALFSLSVKRLCAKVCAGMETGAGLSSRRGARKRTGGQGVRVWRRSVSRRPLWIRS